ncbi:hypothetical protein BO70DRAFT_342104 [Aspergillus heteromorphus CBS 117.55]|uniref:DUF521 domain protein n=1 Tax=Aspergillus heteromorphus CBS 117.55 TaxID=1448321 RepID=A0A317VHW5_9EURO|nr:uncharacterized protein BO70DRAFT_342104 [Aspergillus heteromorphus CBS 117.55]PWY73049.1 hypothetical protein BO70DRAFT_342104 [Aspergillus heteromorphus CBS 117.55]
MLRPNLAGQFVCHGTPYVRGASSGPLVASDLELSFWGGVHPQTGEIIDRHHPLSGRVLRDAILAIPGGRGSCSGSGVMLELLLNHAGPRAIIFERREDILTLGVMIAEEIFGQAIPVVTVKPVDFRRLVQLDGHRIQVADGRIILATNVQLSDEDEAFLEGSHGEAARVALRIILRMADLLDAHELMDVTQVHIDGCIYHGPGSLLFAERLRDWGGRVRVPTTLNSISIDQKRWRSQGVDVAFGEAAEKLASAYTDMGARPTFTCSPYQLDSAPKLGEQVAWAESNAVVYANSVLGARTMKYPDFLDIAIALTGRTPRGGPHVDLNRRASLIIRAPPMQDIDDSLYPLLGYHTGTIASSQIPVILGMESLTPSKDDLKAFGAAFATVSSAPMFHIVGITPEATSLDAVINQAPNVRSIDVQTRDLAQSWDNLNSASDSQPVDLISLGSPHLSLTEIRTLAALCRGRTKKDTVTMMVTCGRATRGLAQQAGLVDELATFGVEFLSDTCWCMITEPTIPRSVATIMTNSGKYAHYGPGLTGRKFYLGSLAGCVDAACQGWPARGRPGWLVC